MNKTHFIFTWFITSTAPTIGSTLLFTLSKDQSRLQFTFLLVLHGNITLALDNQMQSYDI